MDIILYQFPASCARVTMTALEEIGVPYEDRCINLRTNAQKAADYLAINPKAKIPAIVIDGKLMTENAAILHFLHRQFPAAALLPTSDDAVLDQQGLIDLIWCGGTIHPIVRQIRMPVKLTSGDPSGVRADGLDKLAVEAKRMAERIGDRWWYGDAWSIMDVYLYWAYSTAEKGGFPLSDYPELVDHAARVRARPSFQRAMAREAAAVERYDIPDVIL